MNDHPWTADPWLGLNDEQMRLLTHSRRETANLEQTVRLLEERLAEQEAATRHWLDIVKRQLKVISIARQATRWWVLVCDRYPQLVAPWVGSMNLAIAELDGDEVLTAALAERLA